MRGGYDDSAADRMLREAGRLRRSARDEYPCYTEEELRRKTAREIGMGADISWAEETLLYADRPADEKRVTLDELMDAVNATARQRQYVRLMRRLGRQVDVAAECRVDRSAVSKCLSRLFLTITAAYPAVSERMPEDWVRRLFNEEIADKLRQIYHRPTRQKISAYLHEKREARIVARERRLRR